MKRTFRFVSILLLLVLLFGLVEAQFHVLSGIFGGRPLAHRELATRFLGQYLARSFPGKKGIILSNPFSKRPGQPAEVYAFEKAGLRGLQGGLGKAVRVETIAFPELKPGALENPHAYAIPPNSTTPLSYLVNDDALDKVVEQSPDAEIVISLIGLPANVQKTRAWSGMSPRRFGLLLPDFRVLGDRTAVLEGFRSGKIAAAVLNKPGAPAADQPLGKDQRMEFEQRFLLVTPENVERYMQLFPRLF